MFLSPHLNLIVGFKNHMKRKLQFFAETPPFFSPGGGCGTFLFIYLYGWNFNSSAESYNFFLILSRGK
jgi:hypothetical protein